MIDDISALNAGAIDKGADNKGPLCGLADFCTKCTELGYLKKIKKEDQWKYMQRTCKTCLADEGKKLPTHRCRLLTGVYLDLLDKNEIVPTMITWLYEQGALDSADLNILGKGNRFMENR